MKKWLLSSLVLVVFMVIAASVYAETNDKGKTKDKSKVECGSMADQNKDSVCDNFSTSNCKHIEGCVAGNMGKDSLKCGTECKHKEGEKCSGECKHQKTEATKCTGECKHENKDAAKCTNECKNKEEGCKAKEGKTEASSCCANKK